MNVNQDLECPVCQYKSDRQKKFKYLRHHQQWKLWQCLKCTFQFWSPMRQADQKWWEDSYVTYKDLATKPRLEPRHKNLLKNLPLRNGRILDIGCGEGAFLYAMQNRGFDVYGIDINRWAITKGRKLFGHKNLYPMSIYDFTEKEQSKFDLVTFFEVLEHIGDPKKFIIAVKNILNKKAFISFSVPNVEMYGPWEERLNVPPYHFTCWTEKTLKIFLTKNNFKIITMRKIGRPESTSILMNVLIKLTSNKPLFSDFLIKKITFLWRYISFPMREFFALLGLRPTFFIIASLKS